MGLEFSSPNVHVIKAGQQVHLSRPSCFVWCLRDEGMKTEQESNILLFLFFNYRIKALTIVSEPSGVHYINPRWMISHTLAITELNIDTVYLKIAP